MRGKLATFTLLLAAAATPACATSMSGDRHCRVVGGEKLLARSGGQAAICSEIERAVAAAAPKARYSAEVKVLSASRLAATLIVDGRTLPEQNFAIMDSDINLASIKRFAQSLAGEVAKASRP